MITNIASILNPLPCYNVPIKFNSHDRYFDLQKGSNVSIFAFL